MLDGANAGRAIVARTGRTWRCAWHSFCVAFRRGVVVSNGLFRVQHHSLLDSTNDAAKRLADQRCMHGTVVWADEQTGGHGRFGRPWHSPPGNLLVSVVLRPSTPAPRVAELGFVAAVAVAACVAESLPRDGGVGLKWPNDVQVDGAKIAGILPEARSVGAVLSWVVLGVGLNLAHAPAGMPYPVTSLAAYGATVRPEQGLQMFLAHLEHWLRRWETEGFGPVRAAWLAHARGLGGAVTVQVGDRREHGVFHGLDPDGAMLLGTTEGLRRITAGEVAFGPS
jgi:BirA family biotin operon repressor/biotin-[acetyl-CoA-carboxylase] ligase